MVGDTAESRAPGNIIVYGVQCCRIRERATTSIHRGEGSPEELENLAVVEILKKESASVHVS